MSKTREKENSSKKRSNKNLRLRSRDAKEGHVPPPSAQGNTGLRTDRGLGLGDAAGGEPLPLARWPTPHAVCSCSRYMHYALEAGDDPDVVQSWGRKGKGRGEGHGPKTPSTPSAQDYCPKSGDGKSALPETKTTGLCWASETGQQISKPAAASAENIRRKPRKTVNHRRRHCEPTMTTNASSSNSFCGGLQELERDVKGAMVAVWLAWGVRIDAARVKHAREECWLEVVHRAEVEKVSSVI